MVYIDLVLAAVSGIHWGCKMDALRIRGNYCSSQKCFNGGQSVFWLVRLSDKLLGQHVLPLQTHASFLLHFQRQLVNKSR